MKISKHRVGEIFYNKPSNTFFVITDIFDHRLYMGYIPAPERGYNPLRNLNVGGCSDPVFDSIFKPIGYV